MNAHRDLRPDGQLHLGQRACRAVARAAACAAGRGASASRSSSTTSRSMRRTATSWRCRRAVSWCCTATGTRCGRAPRAALAGADLGMVTSYCPDGIAATALLLDAPVHMRCFYDLDTPVTLARIAAGETVDYIGPHRLARLRRRVQLHRRGGAGRITGTTWRAPRRAAVRLGRSGAALPSGTAAAIRARCCRISAPTPPTGSTRWKHC